MSDNIRDYLRDHPEMPGRRYLLEFGREFIPQALPLRYSYGEKARCFRNAFLLASDNRDTLTYAEGYAWVGMSPTLHAFCVDSLGLVYDSTYGTDERPRTPPGDGNAPVGLRVYFGVTFEFDYVNRVFEETIGSVFVLDPDGRLL
jgi:hypothetical protein